MKISIAATYPNLDNGLDVALVGSPCRKLVESEHIAKNGPTGAKHASKVFS